MPLLTSADYNRIRRALSVSLNAVTLPDEVIEDPSFLPAALKWIEAEAPGSANDHAKSAAVFYTAALLAPSMTGMISAAEAAVAGGAGRIVDPAKLRAELLARSDTELRLIESEGDVNESAVQRPTMFSRAKGRRGY